MKRYLPTIGLIILMGLFLLPSAQAQKAKGGAKDIDTGRCYLCHGPVKDLRALGKHAQIDCAKCHTGIDRHLLSTTARPGTDTSWEACGQCHKNQYDSFLRVAYHRPARDEKSQLTNRAPNPFWDKLMMGHGFTKEHALTRSHPWMLIDQLVVDRAFGGRYQPKDGWQYVNARPGAKAWDILVDKYPEVKQQKAFLPQTAAAANSICFQCKSQDHILSWPYLGEPSKQAKWNRASPVLEVAKDLQYGMNCFICHDPHAAKPRIVRDGLIEALSPAQGDTLWHKDPKRTGLQVKDMGVRGFTRKIALLDRYDAKLQCGQCHVEYTCNPGTDTKTGQPVTMADKRTNHIPFKDVFALYDHQVNQINFLDFRHPQTGGLLWKAQHPETETFYNSKHSRAGASCNDCHMPKIQDSRGKKAFTSHFAVTPRAQIKETCLKCHKSWTEEQARYAIDSVKAHIKGKMRKAEFWLTALVDKITEAKKAGVSPEALQAAQDQHLRAHILWEFWTAENSDGFHNPDQARESLTRSVDESQKGIALLDKAMAK